MASIKKQALGRKDLFLIDPKKIQMKPGWNVREESQELTAHIEQLAASISEIGVQESLTVYMSDDVIYLSDGHCRLRGTLLAIEKYGTDIKSVPCRVEDRYANDADRTLSMITRNSGKPLTSLEKSEVVKRLLSFGWTEKDIAAKVGVTVQTIYRLIKINALPEKIKKAVSAGEISVSLALEQIKNQGADQVQDMIDKNKGGGKITKNKIPEFSEFVEKELIDYLKNCVYCLLHGMENGLSSVKLLPDQPGKQDTVNDFKIQMDKTMGVFRQMGNSDNTHQIIRLAIKAGVSKYFIFSKIDELTNEHKRI
jgi:ParB-like chromosome segregation protein Spo0J